MSSSPPSAGSRSLLLDALSAASEELPAGRKLLVAPTRGGGKELLRSMARGGGRWLGWEVLTLRPLALEIVADRLVSHGRHPLDDVGEQALLDEVLDEVLADVEPGPFTTLADGVGFRRAVRGAVQALRLAGVPSSRLTSLGGGADGSGKGSVLARILAGFEARLDRDDGRGRRPVDTAFVLAEAARALAEGAPTGYDRVWLAPGLSRRGLAGRLVDRLLERGATVLEADPVVGLDPPRGTLWRAGAAASALSFLNAPGELPTLEGGGGVEVFHAASVTDELREILRRVMARGLAWDEVEIVATDAGVYGPALHALAGRMGIPVTFGVGLPVERTRAGRAVEQYFRWLEDGLPSLIVRRLFENDTLVPPKKDGGSGGPSGAALARRLRALRIGWGRERYLPILDRAIDGLAGDPVPRRKESPEDARARVRRRRRELGILRAFFRRVFDVLPEVPARVDVDPAAVSPAALARGLRAFLTWVPGRSEVERTALERLDRILLRVVAELDRPTSFAAAVSILREHLEIRVPAPRAEGPAPWRSTGGHLYLTDVEHGGASGRPATFVVGLDAGRTGGAAYQDPMLLDRERRRVGGEALPTSLDRLHEGRFRLAALLAGLRGRVTLSYSAWDPAEARSVLPSALLLQAWRLASGDPTASYTDLHRHLGNPVTAVPRPIDAGAAGAPGAPAAGMTDAAGPAPALADASDVWLHALRADEGLRAGADRVRAAYPGLAAGWAARAALRGDVPSPHHGLVRPRPELDPRESGVVLSASRLESLAACPRRYLFRYVLGVRPREDPTLDPEVWLDPMERGRLLHDVYEGVLRRTLDEGVELDDPAFEALALEVLEGLAGRARRETPPPSDAVHDRELDALRGDVLSFVAWVRDHGLRVVGLERSFGMPGDDTEPVALPVAGGEIRLRGAIDRIDERVGTLHLMDYKTGGKGRYSDADAFQGGRRLQHVLYSRAAELLYDKPVLSFSYVLPTRRAENYVRRYHRSDYEEGMRLVDRLLALAAAGRFLPTEESGDCRFCDFRTVCRVREGRWSVESPLADWGKSRFEDAEEYDELREVRTWSP